MSFVDKKKKHSISHTKGKDIINLLTPRVPHRRVKSSGIRQSKILSLASLDVDGLMET